MKIEDICNQLSTCDLPWSGYKCAYFAAAAWEVFNKLGHELSICVSTGFSLYEGIEEIHHLIHVVLQDKEGRLVIDPTDNFKLVINNTESPWWNINNLPSSSEDNEVNSILKEWEESWLEENNDLFELSLDDYYIFNCPGIFYWSIIAKHSFNKMNDGYVKEIENLMLKHLGV